MPKLGILSEPKSERRKSFSEAAMSAFPVQPLLSDITRETSLTLRLPTNMKWGSLAGLDNGKQKQAIASKAPSVTHNQNSKQATHV